MTAGNQSYFKSTNESVEKYALLVKDYQGEEYISGIYDKISHLKSGLKNCTGHLGWNGKREFRVAKVKISIEEIEEVRL